MKRRNDGMSSYWYFGLSILWGIASMLWAFWNDEPLIASLYLVCSLVYLVGGFVWRNREGKREANDGQTEGGNEP